MHPFQRFFVGTVPTERYFLVVQFIPTNEWLDVYTYVNKSPPPLPLPQLMFVCFVVCIKHFIYNCIKKSVFEWD